VSSPLPINIIRYRKNRRTLQNYLLLVTQYYYSLGTVRLIYRTGTPLPSKNPILYIFSTNIRTEFFFNMLHTLRFFSSKCRLFHNATFFGSCIIRILHTECAKI
jgi:hypothetical protein